MDYKKKESIAITDDTLTCVLVNGGTHVFIIASISGYGHDDDGVYIVSGNASYIINATLGELDVLFNQRRRNMKK